MRLVFSYTNLNAKKMFQKFPIFQYVAVIAGSLNVICTGMQYGWSSSALPKLLHKNSEILLTNDEGCWVAVTLLIGASCGSSLCAIFLDKLGRKSVMLIASSFLLIAWSIIVFATNLILLLLGRFIGGLADGFIFCATPLYFSEIADANVRGFISGLIPVTCAIGMLIVCIVEFYAGMFVVALTAVMFSILSLLTLVWLPESPYYLIMRKRYEEVKHSIHRLQPDKNVDLEFSQIYSAVTSQITNTGKILDLFTVKSNRKSLYVTLGCRAIQQLAGMCAIAFYAETIFKESADNPILFNYGPMLYFSTQIVVLIVSSLIVDRAGRRPLMLISLIGVCLVLLCQTCYFSLKNLTSLDIRPYEIISTIALVVYVISFNIGLQSIPLILIAEIFPINVKSFAIGLSDVSFCVFGMIVTKIFQFTKDEFGLHISFYIFFFCSIFGCIFIYFFVPETKGKILEEIQQQLKVTNKSKKLQIL